MVRQRKVVALSTVHVCCQSASHLECRQCQSASFFDPRIEIELVFLSFMITLVDKHVKQCLFLVLVRLLVELVPGVFSCQSCKFVRRSIPYPWVPTSSCCISSSNRASEKAVHCFANRDSGKPEPRHPLKPDDDERRDNR